jgi:hypothetical protein
MSRSAHPWCNRSLMKGVYFTLCLTEHQFNAACKHLKVTGADYQQQHHGTTYYFENPERERVCIVVIRGAKKRKISEVIGLIAHEAMHVWQETKQFIGEPNPSKEFEAYAVQNIVQELFMLFEKLKHKK